MSDLSDSNSIPSKSRDPFQSDMFCDGLLSMLCITSNPLGFKGSNYSITICVLNPLNAINGLNDLSVF